MELGACWSFSSSCLTTVRPWTYPGSFTMHATRENTKPFELIFENWFKMISIVKVHAIALTTLISCFFFLDWSLSCADPTSLFPRRIHIATANPPRTLAIGTVGSPSSPKFAAPTKNHPNYILHLCASLIFILFILWAINIYCLWNLYLNIIATYICLSIIVWLTHNVFS